VADVGGPSAGAMAWVGKEDLWGLIKGDGTRRLENGQAWYGLFKACTGNSERYAVYKPGSVYVYFPEETLNYAISDLNHVDAFNHICDFMMPEDLELVLTDEIDKVPASARRHRVTLRLLNALRNHAGGIVPAEILEKLRIQSMTDQAACELRVRSKQTSV